MVLADLRSVALFHGCRTSELRLIARLATTIDVPAGKQLCVEGDVGAEFFVIVHGRAHVERAGRTVACLEPGQGFGEVALLARKGVPCRTASVIADEPMRVLVFNRSEFNSLITNVPDVARRLLESVSDVALCIAAERALRGERSERRASGGEYGEVGSDLVVFAH